MRETTLNFELCLDVRKVAKMCDLEDEEGRVMRMLRSEKLRKAKNDHPEKFREWQDRVEMMWKFATWGKPDKANRDSRSYNNILKEVVLPSSTAWHYFYHAGKTRRERQNEQLKAIRQRRLERAKEGEARENERREIVRKLARQGLERHEGEMLPRKSAVKIQRTFRGFRVRKAQWDMLTRSSS